jgi:hypothetical protein
MKAAILVLLAVLFSASCTGQQQQQPAQSFTQDLYNATAALYSQDDHGGTTFRCTATAFEKTPLGYHLLTAKHCTEEKPNAYFVVFNEDSSSPYQRAVVLFTGDDSDIAVFDVITDLIVPVIPLGDEALESVGAPVINIAMPMNLGKLLFHGFIATKKVAPRVDDANKIGLQLPVAGGSSGSAIVSEKQHAIIAVLVEMIVPKTGGVVLTLAVPVSQVKEALKEFNDEKVSAKKLPRVGLFDLFRKN